MEARRVLPGHWRRAEATWEQAETADAKVAAAKQRGLDARGVARTARAAWAKAVASFGQVERLESAWGRAHAAPDVFGPDGRPNDRGRAEAGVATAVAGLTGPDWAEVRNALAGRRCLAFPDRMHRRLGAAEPRPRRREAMAWRWWLLHHRPPTPDRLTGLVRAVGCGCVPGQDERGPYDRVAAVLKDTVRAGSAVECMNSVLRMQQSRHKRIAQAMLDLKRLYWNSRPFRSGPRQEACPYQALGLELPSPNFWELLQADARQLTQSLSIAHNAE